MEQAPQELVDFWNRRAKTYPRYDHTSNSYADSVISKIQAHGLSFSGKSLLDVGAGSGQYTLKLAKLAKSVLALDLSDQMLAISQQEAKNLGLTNIEYVLKPTTEFKAPERFDLVFSSMCPAIRDDLSRQWLLDSAKEAVIYLGFLDYVYPGPMPRLMEHYQVTRKLHNSGLEMEDWFKKVGENFSRYELTGQWVVNYDHQEARHWCLTMLRDFGVNQPDPIFLDECLEPFKSPDSDVYVFKSPYYVDLLIWERKNSQLK
ncbi:MAG: methyltransferase domain-containing protein [Deltaproteobacteria bacterium]|jgi:SAM-dependent methyltransferase|nr:methyltransferase domain-containing protein [Deltaproteobacteria bacterium]